ncbi:acyl carrier protein [Pararcticibacter amylolyticus]|uniref:Acyl carrier protein n=1 Tax=Pararcticibacter amylolyticus TaxID=2173175 RepID=A0A2U2PLM4_9SPHI|nr:acyl carrier protein [Pararcticibacter amylolyticus]PWG82184.1 acyl carrier protein [Pararcticibacter amylolyticus]
MNQEQLLKEVNEIFKDVLDNEDVVINFDTVASDVDDWDSLNHIQLIAAIEKAFRIKFTSTEIYQFKNVGEMISSINSKLNP